MICTQGVAGSNPAFGSYYFPMNEIENIKKLKETSNNHDTKIMCLLLLDIYEELNHLKQELQTIKPVKHEFDTVEN